jgi:hypothetical protein
LASKRETETARDRCLVDFSMVFVVLIWFLIWVWYCFDTSTFWYAVDTIWYDLVRFWYDSDLILIWFRWVGFKRVNRNSQRQVFGRFLDGFCGFDMILIYFFNMVLIRFWYDSDTILIRLWQGELVSSQVEPKQLRNPHFLTLQMSQLARK